MAKAIKYRQLEKTLLSADCRYRQANGSHTIWYCPLSCGKHMVSLVSGHGTVSPALVRDVTKSLICLKLALS